uniref:Uncharacterized protein n=1 Tax=Lygus hesperus TaxID=30085 RepID=A0A0K8T222_LYGHE
MEYVQATISTWCTMNCLVLNRAKTQLLKFGLQLSEGAGLLTIDDAVTWQAHMDGLSKSLARVVYLLRKLSLVSRSVLRECTLRVGCDMESCFGGNSSGAVRLHKADVRIIKGVEARAHCRPIFHALFAMAQLTRVRASIEDNPRWSDVMTTTPNL